MEENIVETELEVIEPEEFSSDVKSEEAAPVSNTSGGIMAGILGGFLAYVVIDGAKKVWKFISAKIDQKRIKDMLASSKKENEEDETKEED